MCVCIINLFISCIRRVSSARVVVFRCQKINKIIKSSSSLCLTIYFTHYTFSGFSCVRIKLQPVHHRCSHRADRYLTQRSYNTVQIVRVRDSRFVHVGSADTFIRRGHCTYYEMFRDDDACTEDKLQNPLSSRQRLRARDEVTNNKCIILYAVDSRIHVLGEQVTKLGCKYILVFDYYY